MTDSQHVSAEELESFARLLGRFGLVPACVCADCNRPLTRHLSIVRGRGPTCEKRKPVSGESDGLPGSQAATETEGMSWD